MLGSVRQCRVRKRQLYTVHPSVRSTSTACTHHFDHAPWAANVLGHSRLACAIDNQAWATRWYAWQRRAMSRSQTPAVHRASLRIPPARGIRFWSCALSRQSNQTTPLHMCHGQSSMGYTLICLVASGDVAFANASCTPSSLAEALHTGKHLPFWPRTATLSHSLLPISAINHTHLIMTYTLQQQRDNNDQPIDNESSASASSQLQEEEKNQVQTKFSNTHNICNSQPIQNKTTTNTSRHTALQQTKKNKNKKTKIDTAPYCSHVVPHRSTK